MFNMNQEEIILICILHLYQQVGFELFAASMIGEYLLVEKLEWGVYIHSLSNLRSEESKEFIEECGYQLFKESVMIHKLEGNSCSDWFIL